MQNRTLTVYNYLASLTTAGFFISLMNKVKFTPTEQEVMDAIAEKGEFLWDMHPQRSKRHEKALKSLHWIELIKRKPTYGNVFIATELGNQAILVNKTADFVNS